jgi:AraC-like DNA-binding protein
MAPHIFYPSDILKPYIKHYWVLYASKSLSNVVLFPSGFMEFAINISEGSATIHLGNRISKMPKLEILGHLTNPTTETISAGTTVLITRFYPHAASIFLPNPAGDFTNNSTDLNNVLNDNLSGFYHQLMEQPSLQQKIKLLEAFLIRRLMNTSKRLETARLVEQLCKTIQAGGSSFNLKKLASRYQISERYIQKIFLDYVGITPQRLFSVQRFTRSLQLVRTASSSLTDIGYECGYYDQAHFIREFKSYTGLAPLQVMKDCQKEW